MNPNLPGQLGCAPDCGEPLDDSGALTTVPPTAGPPGGPAVLGQVTRDTCAGTDDRDYHLSVEALIPADTVIYTRRCPAEAEFDSQILCDPATGERVIVVVNYSQLGTPTAQGFLFDMSPYGGDLTTLVQCDEETESDQVLWCSGTENLTQWIVKVDGQPNGTVYWTDAAGAVIPEPADLTLLRRGPCDFAAETPVDVQSICLIDDVNGDGSVLVSYVESYAIRDNGLAVSSTFIGTFEDATLQVPYTVLGTRTLPCDVGAAARTLQRRLKLTGAGDNWSPTAAVQSYTIRVASVGATLPTFTDSVGTVTELELGEVLSYSVENGAPLQDAPVVNNLDAANCVIISFTELGV